MKKIVFAMGLLVSIFLGQNIYAQCMDTLSIKVSDFFSFRWKGFTYTNLKDLTIVTADSTKYSQNQLAIDVDIENVSNKTYSKQDTFGFHVVLTTGNDTLLDKRFYCDRMELAPGDTDGVANDSTTILYRFLKKGTYKVYASVIYTSRDGYFCDSIVELSSKTVTFYVDTKAPVQQVAQETSLNVFPNPARERINVECETEMRRVTLCNALGQQVLRVNPNAPQAELQVAGLPRGLYLLRVQTANGNAVRKVVVE